MRRFAIKYAGAWYGYIAPNPGEAIAQCREHLDITEPIDEIEEVHHAISLYKDTETLKLVTEDTLYVEYMSHYPTRDITFVGYINNCTDKNGFLERI